MNPDEKLIDLRRQLDAAQAKCDALGYANVYNMSTADKVALDLRVMAANRKREVAFREYQEALEGYLAT